MSTVGKVVFEVTDASAEEELIRKYISPVFGRVEARDDAEWAIFNRYAYDPSMERGEVVLSLCGDVGTIIQDERSHWHQLTNDGIVKRWSVEYTTEQFKELPKQDRDQYRMRATASRMSLEFYSAFDELPSALTDTGNEPSIGWDMCLHHIINQLGYQTDDGNEEIELLFQSVCDRLHAKAVAPSIEDNTAQRMIDSLIEELESLSSTLNKV